MEDRFFLWNDGDGHKYCVPVSLRGRIDELEKLHPVYTGYSDAEYYDKWEEIFNDIEPQLMRVEGVFTFSNPKCTWY